MMLKQSGVRVSAAAILAMIIVFIIALSFTAPVYAEQGDPAMVTGTEAVLKKTAGKSNAQIVYYGSKGGWYVIAYDGKDGDGKAITYTHKGKTKNLHTSGNITLLQKNVDAYGLYNDATLINPWGTQYGWFKNKESDPWEPSRIRVAIEEGYLTKENARFDIKEQRVISPRTLEGGNVDYSDHDHQPYTKPQPDFDPNTILGDKVEDAVLWLLSEAEVLALPKNIVKTNDVYCLRTPGMRLKEPFSGKDPLPFIRSVSTDGTFRGTSYSDLAMCKAGRQHGLRPAFDLKPDDIIFTSAAVGGKESGNVGADALTPVGKNSNNEWKVTIWDGHGDFSFGDATTCDGKRLNIPYYSAAKEKNGFISAIIKDAKGSIKYYGRLKEVTSSSTYGTVHINIDGKLRKGDTLLMFNEQYNGDKKTDYASQPTEVEIPAAVTSHDMKYYPAVEPGCGKDGSSEYWECRKCSRFYSDAEGNNEIAEGSWVIKGRSHTPNEPVVENHVEPSCTSTGRYDSVVYCGNCNAEISRKSEIEPKLDHNWNDWVVVEAATLFIEGLETRKCKDCNAIETRAIPRLDHDHVLSHIEAVPATCEESGNIEYWRCDGGDEPCGRFFSDKDGKNEIYRANTIIPALGHVEEDEWEVEEEKDATCTEDGYTKWILRCAECNKVIDTECEYETAKGHDSEYPRNENVIRPTCQSEGSRDEVVYCYFCDEELSRQTFTIPKLDHIWGEWKEVRAATELKEGEEQRKCSKCGSTESRSIPELTHTHHLTHYDANTATCTGYGNTEYWLCDEGEKPCGRYFSDSEGENEIDRADTLVPTTGHTPGDHWDLEEKEPTCTEKGYTKSVLRCKVCNEEVSSFTVELEAKGHTPVGPVHQNIVPATCEKDGSYDVVTYCGVCGEELSKKAVTEPKLGHSFGEWKEIKAPTETKEGEEKRECTRCNKTEVRAIPRSAHKHQLVHYNADSATCTENGNIEFWQCLEGENPCGGYFSDKDGENEISRADTIVSTTGHTPAAAVIENVTSPTCKKEGSHDTVIYCSDCSAELSRKTITDSKLEHDWTAWVEETAPTETSEGKEKRSCNNCDAVEERKIPVIGHVHHLSHIDAEPATCTEYGHTEYWQCDSGDNPCGRYFSDKDGNNEIDRAATIAAPTGHTDGTWNIEEKKDPTCTEKGWNKNVLRCKTCKEEISSFTTEVDAKGHMYGEWKTVKAATELEEGQEQQKCSGCDSVVTRNIPRLKHIHKLSHIAAEPATCTESGNIEVWQCLDGENPCGGYFQDKDGKHEISRADTMISAKGHSATALIIENEKKPTCTESGSYDKVMRCLACNEVISLNTVQVSAKGHKWGAWKESKAATELKEGEEQRKCSECEEVESRSIPKKAHEHKLTHYYAVSPTCTEDGNIEFWQCDEGENPCGRYFSDSEGRNMIDRAEIDVDVKGHKPKAAVIENEKKPTCKSDGSHDSVIYCEYCGKELSRKTVADPKTYHVWGAWKEIKAATETKEGTEQRTCTLCQETETRTIPKLTHKHMLIHYYAIPATCTENGNAEFWQCLEGENPCGRYFSDSEGKNEIDRSATIIMAKGHTEGDWEIKDKKDPTCTENGYIDKVLHCTECNEVLSSLKLDVHAAGHDWGVWKEVKAATELKEGEEQKKCSRCNASVSRAIPKQGHKHKVTHYNAEAPTCTESGHKEYWLCDEGENPCGRYFSDSEGKNEINRAATIISAKGHTPKAAVVENEKKPTCKKDGSYDSVIYCDDCGKELSRKTVTEPKLDHKWGAWKETKAATETEEGTEQRTCALCKETETRTIPKLTHKHVLTHFEADPATCTENGNTEFWQCLEGENPCGRYFSDSEGKNEIDRADAIIKAKGHTDGEWKIENRKDPTCTEKGRINKVLHCADCGEVIDTFTAETDVKGHTPADPVIRNIKTPTCEEDGSYDNVTYCETCGCELSRTTMKDKKINHVWGAWKVTRAATETEEGEEKRTCLLCQKTESRPIPKVGHVHKLTHYDAIAVTCTDDGNTEFWQCLDGENPCGRYFSDSEGKHEIDRTDTIIRAKGHAEGVWKIGDKKEPTCSESGWIKNILRCTECNEVIDTFTTEIDALGHNWGEWKESKAATEKKEGEEQRKCTRCGASVSRSIPKLTHKHRLTHYEAEAATCTEGGHKEYWLCDEGDTPCGRYFSDSDGKHEIDRADVMIKAKGHIADEAKEENVVAPSCDKDGSYDSVICCKVCGRELSRKTLTNNKTGHFWKAWEVVKAATETEEGQEKRECKLCEKTETRAIPVLSHDHKLIHFEAEPATCTEYGNREYWRCLDGENPCGRYFFDNEGKDEIDRADTIIYPDKHSEGERKIENRKEPTCTEKGRFDTVLRCSECGEIMESFTTVTEAKGHSWNAGIVTKEPTTTAEGVRTFTCMTCLETRTEKIDKLEKKANPFKIKGRTAKVKFRKVRKKSVTLKPSKVIKTVKKGYGKKSYKLISAKKGSKNYKKYFKVNKKTGKIKIKKGLRKGTYKIKIKVKAAGNASYKSSGWKKVTCKIKVK